HGVAMSASLGLTAQTDLSSEDGTVSRRGEDLLRRAIDVVAEAGGQHLCGVIYSAMQKYMAPATSAGRGASAAALARLGEHARGAGVELSLEIVNRYETNIVNTARAGLGFLAEIGSDNVHLHLDTYHMNIEESGMYAPILDAGQELHYFHIGESHRGYLGRGLRFGVPGPGPLRVRRSDRVRVFLQCGGQRSALEHAGHLAQSLAGLGRPGGARQPVHPRPAARGGDHRPALSAARHHAHSLPHPQASPPGAGLGRHRHGAVRAGTRVGPGDHELCGFDTGEQVLVSKRGIAKCRLVATFLSGGWVDE